jgi:hypothetical protein
MWLIQSCNGKVQGCQLTDPVLRRPGLFITGRGGDMPDVESVYPMLLLIEGARLNLGNMACKFDQFVDSRVQWQLLYEPRCW